MKRETVGGFSLSASSFRLGENAGGEMVMIPEFGDITGNSRIVRDAETLPEKFDLRDTDSMTPVRDQGSYGTCWAHSAAASAESGMKKYLPDVDISEFHTAFYAYYGDDQIKKDLEPERLLSVGGASIVAANLWSQWIGPVMEKKLPYGDISFFDDNAAVDAMKYESDLHLKNAYMFDYDDERSNVDEVNSIIKNFVYNGQAVDVSFQNDNSKYYSSTYFSTRSDRKPRFATHSVAIAGWDDNFPKENFKIPAETDGAWLVKNSWGEGSFDNGYMWISYDDRTLCEFAVFELEDPEDHTVNFHHDTYVPAQSMSAGDVSNGNVPSYMANIFTTDEKVQIDSISTSIIQPDTQYEITIYSGITDPEDPTSGTASSATRGTAKLTGTVTIDLDESVIVDEGESFSVVMKAYSEESPFVVPIEAALYLEVDGTDEKLSLGSYTTYEGIRSNTHKGESFFSEDGKEWNDMTGEDYHYSRDEVKQMLDQLHDELFDGIYPDEAELLDKAQGTYDFYKESLTGGDAYSAMGNIALKALGNPVNTVHFSHMSGYVPGDEAVELSVNGGDQIYYSVNNGKLQPYTEPIVLKGYNLISATTDKENFTERGYIFASGIPEKGDVNCDGKVDASDASLVLIHYSNVATGGTGTLKKAIIDYSDMDDDGKVDSVDAGIILKIYADRSTK